MSDLISRQAVRFVEMDEKQEHPKFNLDDAYAQGFADCLEKVLALPSIDAVPVKHAKLLDASPVGLCSECGFMMDYREEFNYCPNCGARMDGEEDGKT